ncbi:MAG TPA: hypothetical protein DCK83_00560 [Gallionellaceae bacterium]|nr:hypothetical protein [Gallionellaceae bacterium]
MNTAAERQTLTADELRAAFKASRLKFTCGYGLLTALQIPCVRISLEMTALALRKKQQHGTPAPMQQAA